MDIMDIELPNDAPPPRLCHLIKWSDYDGYGFNLHGEKTKPGQYIGKVDSNSPAEAGGLRTKDRIIEVNGSNISNENHKQVVQRIKQFPNQTTLLVVEDGAEEFYLQRNIIITSTLPNIIYIQTPQHTTTIEHRDKSQEDVKEDEINFDYEEDEEECSSSSPTPPPPPPSSSSQPPTSSSTSSHHQHHHHYSIKSSSSSSSPDHSSLDLNMTAQEMRAKLASRKKIDPKNSKLDLKKKYDIIQTL